MTDLFELVIGPSQYIVAPCLLVFLILEIYSLSVYKPKNYDRSALSILGAYTICMATKAASILIYNRTDSSPHFKITVDMINMATDIIIWAMLFFFVFEMRSVSDLINSSSNKEFLHR